MRSSCCGSRRTPSSRTRAVSLIDTGYAGSLPRLDQALADLGRTVADVRRVICTHGHPDHAGGARALADWASRVLIHPADAANLELGLRRRHPAAVARAVLRGHDAAAADVHADRGWRRPARSSVGSRSSTRRATRPAACASMAGEHGVLFVGRRPAAPLRTGLVREQPVQRRPDHRAVQPCNAWRTSTSRQLCSAITRRSWTSATATLARLARQVSEH